MTEQVAKQNAPYAVASLVLGISSLVFGCVVAGLVLGIVGLVLGNKGKAAYNANPELYTGEGMLKAGRITSIIGIVFGGIVLIWGLIASLIAGSSFFALFELLNLADML